MRVAEILKAKDPVILSVRPTETIQQLAQRLRMERVGAMIVSSDGVKIQGIISERDVAHGLAEHGSSILELKVEQLMTRSVITCKPDDSISDIAKVMTERRIRHLPVEEAGRLVGIVSVGDVVKHRMDELQLEANVLRDYAVAAH